MVAWRCRRPPSGGVVEPWPADVAGSGAAAACDALVRAGGTPLTPSRRGTGEEARAAGGGCDNTLSPPHPVGGMANQTLLAGSPVGEYLPRKETPKSTHARRRPGGGAPRDKHELCDRVFTCPRRRPRGSTHASRSYPVCSPQTLRKFPSDTLKGPFRKLPADTLKEPSKNPGLRAHGASLSGGQPKLRITPRV